MSRHAVSGGAGAVPLFLHAARRADVGHRIRSQVLLQHAAELRSEVASWLPPRAAGPVCPAYRVLLESDFPPSGQTSRADSPRPGASTISERGSAALKIEES